MATIHNPDISIIPELQQQKAPNPQAYDLISIPKSKPPSYRSRQSSDSHNIIRIASTSTTSSRTTSTLASRATLSTTLSSYSCITAPPPSYDPRDTLYERLGTVSTLTSHRYSTFSEPSAGLSSLQPQPSNHDIEAQLQDLTVQIMTPAQLRKMSSLSQRRFEREVEIRKAHEEREQQECGGTGKTAWRRRSSLPLPMSLPEQVRRRLSFCGAGADAEAEARQEQVERRAPRSRIFRYGLMCCGVVFVAAVLLGTLTSVLG